MGWKSAGVLLLASLFVAAASVWTLGQVRDLLHDANGREGRFAAAEEGQPLDAGDVDWLSWAPDRTRVDADAARDAFLALEDAADNRRADDGRRLAQSCRRQGDHQLAEL